MAPASPPPPLEDVEIDPKANRFPFCIVWSPLPPITWLFPMIGHMGIADSKGIIYDFAGPYTIGQEHMAFGNPTRYLNMEKLQLLEGASWDDGIAQANAIYKKRMHNIFCDNCHSHVAVALEKMPYGGQNRHWNMVILCYKMLFQGKFVNNTTAIVSTWGPFSILLLLVIIFSLLFT